MISEIKTTACPWYNVEKEIQKRHPKVYRDGNVGVILSCVICTPNLVNF